MITFLILCYSCNTDVKKTATYFGGKIINPKSDYVVLYQKDKVIDTFFIDKNNKFLGKIDSISEGLFYFTHGEENQYLYIEPKDSIMLSLNTWDFDESLVFSGHGAERNNILIDCFLQFEKDEKKFYEYSALKPMEFKAKADSLIALKLNTYEEYVTSHPNETEGYREILKTALTFPVYSRIEGYPNLHAKRLQLNNFPEIPASFYDYRSKVINNKESLMYYPLYSMYMINYLYNQTYSKGYLPMKNNFSSEFTIDLLKTIDQSINSEVFKNAYLKHTIISHFYSKSTCDINREEFNVFLKLSTNDKDKELIKKILNDNTLLHANQKMVNLKITNFTNTDCDLQEVIKNKKSLLFFWNASYNTKSSISSRINFLQKKYPNILFITIETEQSTPNKIDNFDIKNQYYIKNKDTQTSFLSSGLNRAVLINKKGIVINGFASISSKNIYKQLDSLSKN